MKNIFHLLSALVLLITGLACITISILHLELRCVVLSIYLIVCGVIRIVNFIKSKKANQYCKSR